MSVFREQAYIDKIRDLEELVNSLEYELAKEKLRSAGFQETNEGLRRKNDSLTQTIDNLRGSAINPVELENLRIENDRLRMAQHNDKREVRARKILADIAKMTEMFNPDIK